MMRAMQYIPDCLRDYYFVLQKMLELQAMNSNKQGQGLVFGMCPKMLWLIQLTLSQTVFRDNLGPNVGHWQFLITSVDKASQF